MADGNGFSGNNLTLPEIGYFYLDTEQSLKSHFGGAAMSADPSLVGVPNNEVLRSRLAELGETASLSILAAMEAAFRIDYLTRCKRKMKDDLARAFRGIYREREERARLEEDILDMWREHGGADSRLIGYVKDAFNYRHWLAHGRYWTGKFGRTYDYFYVYTLADQVFGELDLVDELSGRS